MADFRPLTTGTHSPGGHPGGPDIYAAARPDGMVGLRLAQGRTSMDIWLEPNQADELASYLLDAIYSAQLAARDTHGLMDPAEGPPVPQPRGLPSTK